MRQFQSSRTFIALCANAGLLLLILLAVAARDGRSTAFAQSQNPSQPTGGAAVMPGQLSPNTWGCYVIDQQNQTLCVYEYSRGEHNLHLAASRDIQYDRRLTDYNTTPKPAEIKQMLDRADEPARAVPPAVKSPETANP